MPGVRASVHPPFGLVMRLARVIGRVRPETGGAAKLGGHTITAPDFAIRGRFAAVLPAPYQKKARCAVITRPVRTLTSSTSL